jgi:hypothetical protein
MDNDRVWVAALDLKIQSACCEIENKVVWPHEGRCRKSRNKLEANTREKVITLQQEWQHLYENIYSMMHIYFIMFSWVKIIGYHKLLSYFHLVQLYEMTKSSNRTLLVQTVWWKTKENNFKMDLDIFHKSHICDIAQIGHLHKNPHVPQCKTQMQTLQL